MADAFRDRLDGSLNEIKKAVNDDKKFDVPEDRKFIGFDAYKQAIALADVAILATPPGFRPIHFEEAVRQGKNIFMEKPVAIDGAGVKQVLAAAEEAKKKNLKVGVGLQRHHQAAYIETIKRLHDGAIGDITAARCYWNDGGVWVKERRPDETEMQYQMRNWYYFVWLGGDHIVEQHIHNLDVINWVKNGFQSAATELAAGRSAPASNTAKSLIITLSSSSPKTAPAATANASTPVGAGAVFPSMSSAPKVCVT